MTASPDHSSPSVQPTEVLSEDQQLKLARSILRREQTALAQLAERLDDRFTAAVRLCFECSRHVVVTGMGKAGLVGRKISASLSSLGTRSRFLHPAEAFHGDLGSLHPEDVLLVLSFSGNTEEVVRLMPSLRDFGSSIIALTGNPNGLLAKQADIVLDIGQVEEACELGLAPTTSTTLMLALGDALALVTARLHNFAAEDFARYHPGGSLGRRLAKVEDCMRPLHECRCAAADTTVRQVLIDVSLPGRRSGAVMLTDQSGKLAGIFTDSDLARLFENHHDDALDRPIGDVMTRAPVTVLTGSRLGDAIGLLATRRISELPVVDVDGFPLGLIDITDVLDTAVVAASQEDSRGPASESSCRPTLPFKMNGQRESA